MPVFYYLLVTGSVVNRMYFPAGGQALFPTRLSLIPLKYLNVK